MTETLYPIGYGAQMVTLAALRAKHEPHMHPEYARRLFAWIESCGGLVGIGGGFRPLGTQPDRFGFAPEGMSFHQPQPFRGYPSTYSAVDLVVAVPGGKHRAPRWSEVPAKGSNEAARRGLHCHIASESWHMQCVEMRGYTTWRLAGCPDPQRFYPLPSSPAKVYAPKPTQKRRPFGFGALNARAEVVALQNLCNWWGFRDAMGRRLTADGEFGANTEQATRKLQAAVGVLTDGVYGPLSALATQRFLDVMIALAATA